MNKILCVGVLLVVTLAITSARSYRSLKEVAVYKKELSRRYASHGQRLWQMLYRRDESSEQEDVECEVVHPCFADLVKDLVEVYKTKGTLEQCRTAVGDLAKCVGDKVDDGSLCKSCERDAQAYVVAAMQGVKIFQDVVCADFMEGTNCNKEVRSCLASCLNEEDEEEMGEECVECVDKLSTVLESNSMSKCPAHRLLKEIKFTIDVMGPFIEAFFSGCTEEDMETCKPHYGGVDCSSAAAVEAKLQKGADCLTKLGKDKSGCKALAKVADLFEEKKDLMVELTQRDCKAQQTVDKACGNNKKKRLLELLQRFLEK